MTGSIWTRAGTAIVASLSFAGCLFPSFDGLRREARDDGTDVADVADTTTETDETSADATKSDAASGTASGQITCGDTVCEEAADFCCTTIGGPDCQQGTESFCTGVEGGRILRCDDDGDCGAGQTCCYLDASSEAACRADCAGGRILCNAQGPGCPGGKTCTGVLEHPQGFTSSFCQ